MIDEIRYIYFEIHWCVGDRKKLPQMSCENVLLFEPTMNLSNCGVYGHRNVYEIRSNNGDTSISVREQVWIDLNTYKPDVDNVGVQYIVQSPKSFDDWVQECVSKLKMKLRQLKISSLEDVRNVE